MTEEVQHEQRPWAVKGTHSEKGTEVTGPDKDPWVNNAKERLLHVEGQGGNVTRAGQAPFSCSGFQGSHCFPPAYLSDGSLYCVDGHVVHVERDHLPLPQSARRLWPQCIPVLPSHRCPDAAISCNPVRSWSHKQPHFFGTPRSRCAVQLTKQNFRDPCLPGPLAKAQEEPGNKITWFYDSVNFICVK